MIGQASCKSAKSMKMSATHKRIAPTPQTTITTRSPFMLVAVTFAEHAEPGKNIAYRR